MPAWLDGAPFWPLFAFFFGIVLVRTQATYWIARLVTVWSMDSRQRRPAWVRRVALWLESPAAERGVRAVERWGLIAVPASFLASGTKTVVNAAAGLMRMPFARYTVAMLVGCAAHATIYATIGWAAWTAALAAASGSPWGVGALVAVAALVAILIWRRRRNPREL